MTIIRIEHTVPSYEKWKEVFDRDPGDRGPFAEIR